MEKKFIGLQPLASIVGFDGGFTVLMAVYGKDDVLLFERSVQSVYENTLQPDAFILVIDGPVPLLLEKTIKKLQQKFPIETLKLPVNGGLAVALNAGLEKVKTRWVARADADDYNLQCRFALQADAIVRLKGEVDIIGGAIQEVELDGSPLSVRRTVETHAEILGYVVRRNPFNHMAVAYKVDFVRKCGGYPDIHLKEDYALWAKMLGSGARGYNIPSVLVLATAGKEMFSRRGGARYARAEMVLQQHLVRVGLKSPLMALIHGLMRAAAFLLPTMVRGWVYKFALRSKTVGYS